MRRRTALSGSLVTANRYPFAPSRRAGTVGEECKRLCAEMLHLRWRSSYLYGCRQRIAGNA